MRISLLNLDSENLINQETSKEFDFHILQNLGLIVLSEITEIFFY